jgi:Tol biopolymer transport system component
VFLLVWSAAAEPHPVWTSPGANHLGAPSRDGKWLSSVDPETRDLALRDLATGTMRRLTDKGSRAASKEFAYFSTIAPDSSAVAYAWFNREGFYELRLSPTEGGPARVLFSNEEAGFVQPTAWSPDGKRILTLLFRKDNVSQIALIDAKTGSVRVLKSLNWVYPKKMDFSPDGRWIVYDSFSHDGAKERDLFVLSVDGSREQRLVENPAEDSFPIWSPDGSRVYFASDRGGAMGLWAAPVADGRPAGEAQLVLPGLGRFLPMGITAGGKLYYCVRAGSPEIRVGFIDRESREVLGAGRIGEGVGPQWSPDGSRLAWLVRRGAENFGEEARAVVVRSIADGSQQTLSPKMAIIERISWSPDARWLLASGSDDKARGGLYRIEVATGRTLPVVQSTEAPFRGYEGVWSQDGATVLYLRNGIVNERSIETGEERELAGKLPACEPDVRLPKGAEPPASLHPDGRNVAFTYGQTRPEVWVVDLP